MFCLKKKKAPRQGCTTQKTELGMHPNPHQPQTLSPIPVNHKNYPLFLTLPNVAQRLSRGCINETMPGASRVGSGANPVSFVPQDKPLKGNYDSPQRENVQNTD